MHIVAILNRDGGTLRTMDIDALCVTAKAVFERHGHTLECEVVDGADVEARLGAVAARKGVDAMLAAGGDGTMSTAAGIAFETGMPLAVLPAGTMNLFARALKVPLALPEALEALAAGDLGAVDIATANGRPFVHQFGVGIHARLVRIREGMTYHSRIGKMLSSLRAIGAAAIRPPQFEAEFRTRRGVERRLVSGIAVSNNRLGEGHIPYAEALHEGILGVYVAMPMSSVALIKLAIEVLLGRWRGSAMVSERKLSRSR